MHATSTQTRTDPGKVLTAVLAASLFAAGVALGAIVGTTVAPSAEPAAVGVPALDPGAPWFREHRNGEINAGSDPASVQVLDPDAGGLRQFRDGEINAGSDPAGGIVSTERREKIGGP
jgi:hypothetical protein